MKTLLCLSGVLMIFACSPVRVVSTDISEETDFSSYRTYNFYSDETGMSDAPNFPYIKQAIGIEMTQRGFSINENPDLKVNIAIDKEQKQQTRETDFRDAPVYMGTRSYQWESEEIVVREYEEGTVKIDLVDTKTNELVWQGIAAGTISGDQSKMNSRIDKAIDAVFSKFPIKEK